MKEEMSMINQKRKTTILAKDDERWISRHIVESEKHELSSVGSNANANDNVNGSGNDAHKLQVKTESEQQKPRVIDELKVCTYRTSPKKVASLLEFLFSRSKTKAGHWLWIAQHYPPRTINRVISRVVKQHNNGEVSIKNPAAYFTFLIKMRKKRKVFRSSNATHKRHQERKDVASD